MGNGESGLCLCPSSRLDYSSRQRFRRETKQAWQLDYNARRPHCSLGHLTPNDFVTQRQTLSVPGKICVETDPPSAAVQGIAGFGKDSPGIPEKERPAREIEPVSNGTGTETARAGSVGERSSVEAAETVGAPDTN